MAESRDREFLLGIFLMEAWDTAGALEDGLGLLTAEPAPTAEALGRLLVVSHRLKGSAALHGFPAVSELAAVTEQLLERASSAPAAERAETAKFVGEIVGLFKDIFDRISGRGAEDTERIAAFKARHPTVFASAGKPEAPEKPAGQGGLGDRATPLVTDPLGSPAAAPRPAASPPAAPRPVASPAAAARKASPPGQTGLGGRATPSVTDPLGSPPAAARKASAPGQTGLGGRATPSVTDPLGSPPAAPRPADSPPAAPRQASTAAYQLVQEVDRFFADSGEILTYFGPEATEHFEAMTQSLLALEAGGRNDEELNRLFRAVHTLKGAAYTVGCTPIGDVAHQIEDLLGAVRENRIPFAAAVTETVFAGVDALKMVLQSAGGSPPGLGEALERALDGLRALMSTAEMAPGEIVAETAEAAAAAGPAQPATMFPGGRLRPEFLARLEALPRPAPVLAQGPTGPSIRVSVDRLDALMNLVGELMIARSRLDRRLVQLDQIGELLLFSRSRMAQAVRDFESKHHFPQVPGTRGRAGDRGPDGGMRDVADLFAEMEFDRYDDFNILARSVAEMSADIAEVQAQHAGLIRAVRDDVAQVQRLTAALRKEVTRARMVPIGRLFPRFTRQVREAARAAGKDVALEVRGESAEVDNSIMEQIADPLLHLVQNAVSHGIEPEAERLARGKPAQGTISLRAYHQGAFLYVEVEDDGRGIDAELLRQEAVESGLLRAEEARALSIQEALNLIFVPGFSTASEVTRASGRGVGMDVVRTNVSRLNGEIEVDTEVGARTRFTLKLPLTVAIADALLARVGSEVFAFPLMAVSAMRHMAPTEIHAAGDRETVRVDDQVTDLIRLDRVLNLPHAEPGAHIPMVVMRGGGKPFAILVDELLGKEEIVIKSLGEFLEGVGPFAGATISGEGRVILLVDPTRLLEASRRQPAAAPEAAEARPLAARAPEAARSVMLVDDSISIRKYVGQMLEKAGFRVFTAVDGQDALQQLTDLSVGAIITDLEMPRVNGYALIEDLRRRPNTREVPIVVLTTRAGEKHVNVARRLGVRHYITKPVDEQTFIRLVESLTAGAPSETALSGARTT
jgi:chemosensory pili system protein ChpA (sensor histidine kinase/response regulator)